MANGSPVLPLTGGKSDFGGEVRQMMPPFMDDGRNTAERLIANMDYAGVSGAVITQEEIDGNQDEYLLSAKKRFQNRLKICSLYEENKPYTLERFDGIKICAGRLREQDLTKHDKVFAYAAQQQKFVSVDLADGDRQTASLAEMIRQYPDLRIAIGHFGMVTKSGWKEQIKLARNKNVRIESGGYDHFHDNQIEWYENTIKSIAKEVNGDASKVVPSLAFFHVPMQEYTAGYDAAKGTADRIWGYRFEKEGSPAVDDQMFETMLELGSTKGVFVGHDHMNNYSVNYKGIRLTYGLSCDHNIYVVPFRGGKLINIKEDGSFTTQSIIRHRGQSTVTIGKEK